MKLFSAILSIVGIFAQVVVVAMVGAKVPTMEDPVEKAVVGGVK